MRGRKITAVDVCEVTGYSRNQLRGLLDELPGYSEQETTARIAREFARADLSVLSVIHVLESKNNVRRGAIATIAEILRKTLVGPKAVNRNARLLISFDPPKVNYFTSEMPSNDGILISLAPIFERVDRYLNYGLPYGVVEPELNLGPGLVSNKREVATKR